jgi:acetoacetyl-CoA synthetase
MSPAPVSDNTATGSLLWEPSEDVIRSSNLRRYMDWLAEHRGLRFADYASLYAWSVGQSAAFWTSIWQYFSVDARSPYAAVLEGERMPDIHWFRGATLNYAEHALRAAEDRVAVIARDELGQREQLSYGELARRVASVRCQLLQLGAKIGDRVAGFLPNTADAVVAFLATASIGAIWSSCPPEFGPESVLSRFSQIEPKFLIAVSGYHYGGKYHDRTSALDTVVRGLPSLHATLLIEPRASASSEHTGSFSWKALPMASGTEPSAPLEFVPVPFEHPLWILYSSGTTGLPKAIVQGQGGILLEHFKELGLNGDLKPEDRFFWFSTTGWMMWNYLVSGLLHGATIVLYDGSPGYPDLGTLWRMAARERVTYFGTSAPFLLACRKAGLEPGRDCDLSALRGIGSTGAPLPEEGFAWVYHRVKHDVWLGSMSGGTDVCSAFVGTCPLLPVHAGELQCRSLGAKVEAFDEAGNSVEDEVGELVLTAPLPSMPIFFWNDPGDERYRASYFERFPGIWCHGDWIRITPRGSAIIYGRSDATLNRGGVRMGTSEFYSVVEGLSEILDSLVIDSDGENAKLWLFVVLKPGATLDAALRRKIKDELRRKLSPRHVPDEILQIDEVPRTLSGKKLEVPVKRVMAGVPLDKAVNPGTLKNAEALFSVLKATHATSARGPH